MNGVWRLVSALPDGGGPAPGRRVGRALLLSFAAHGLLGGWLLVVALMDVGAVPPPPITIRFFASAPPPPRLVPLREARTPPRPVAPPATMARPLAPLPPPAPVPRPEPPPLKVEPEPVPIRVADRAPDVRVHDAALPAPTPALAPLGAHALPQVGTGEEPDLALLVRGHDHDRGPGGTIAGRSQPRVDATGDPAGSLRRGGALPGDAPPATLGSEDAFAGAGLASFLGRKYGVSLVDAGRLGARTSDGARYATLVPALSEAYRSVSFRGRRPGAEGGPVESVQADADAVAIRYRDGTVHVLVPTPDGLVALYVSAAAAGSGGRSKVEEAERALNALRSLAPAGRRG